MIWSPREHLLPLSITWRDQERAPDHVTWLSLTSHWWKIHRWRQVKHLCWRDAPGNCFWVWVYKETGSGQTLLEMEMINMMHYRLKVCKWLLTKSWMMVNLEWLLNASYSSSFTWMNKVCICFITPRCHGFTVSEGNVCDLYDYFPLPSDRVVMGEYYQLYCI